APRLALEDTEVGGVPIPLGSTVILVWGSANHDEKVFASPEQFDIERENVREHVGFGYGIHFCMGAPLGRIEAAIAFHRIFAWTRILRASADRNDFANHRSILFRGPRRLFVEFDPA